jgi:predicted nuclease of restriction endonuclease-like (RecB) superfamily
MASRKQARRQPPATPRGRSARAARGRTHPSGATFPVAPPRAASPHGYATTLAKIKQRIQRERLRVVMSANAAMVQLYWDIGRMILERQKREGWGAKVVDRLATDLRDAYPDMQGLSPRNLKYMRSFAAAWPDKAIVQAALAQIPWYHHIALLQKCKTPQERLWYARQSAEQGWSHNIPHCRSHPMPTDVTARRSLTSRRRCRPPTPTSRPRRSRTPDLFDFLGTADPRRESEVEQALVDQIQRFLLELGSGFAFVGRQVLLEVGDQDFVLDLLFYHLKLRRYVVIELKAVRFDPAFVGQLNLYLSAVDDLLRHADDQPTIGLLLCRGKDDRLVVEYALRGMKTPIGVAGWETSLVEKLPKDLRGSLPTVAEIEAELAPKRRKR